jgi:soluble lytic murein transglycosylase
LLQFKLDTLAVLTWRTIPAKTKNNPWFLYVYARRFQERGLWREAYRVGLQLSYKMPPDRWGTAPKEVLRLIYPRPYEGLVQKYTSKRGLDPAFVYALMRQESGFDREIKSGAGAIGLMQMMPATGKAIAKKERWPKFDPYSLTEPEVNIGLGTAYLRDLKKEYRGGFHWVLANYNAGPEATRRWMTAAATPAPAGPAVASLGMTAPGLPVGPPIAPTPGTWATGGERPLDAVVEDISYWETRDYVKKVMGNYWTYRLLWNNRSHSAAAP